MKKFQIHYKISINVKSSIDFKMMKIEFILDPRQGKNNNKLHFYEINYY